ncbi:MAG: anti-sigma factor antagonist [Actinophytocola sp.]|uniref:STAS domain-containing protein n=1 Tax=Actinophytocola sp. TaxID=1872138 RepID=UPI00132B0C9D|nr:STAS domain-containing protein [Actinophytocola sp.]MPZ82547.1 anti-sigma factor antagonist [Actinophytocola sp.]
MTAALPSTASDDPLSAATSPRDDLLTVTTRRVSPDTVVLEVRGDLDMSTSPTLQNVLLSHLHDAASQVTVDLTGVSFLSAAGLTVLVNAKQAAVAAGRSLCVVACARVVLLPLTITGLDGVFDIYPELADAPLGPVSGPDG